MATPELWIIAGPNGAGKTTLTQRAPLRELLSSVTPLNPDDRTRLILRGKGFVNFADAPEDVLRDSFVQAAGQIADELIDRLHSDEAVCIETVLSTDKYKSPVEYVLHQSGFVGLIYVALRTPQLAVDRVASRVEKGGHNVPADRIVARWRRSLETLPWFAKRSHRFWVFDNADPHPKNPPTLLANGGQGEATIHHAETIPEITEVLRSLSDE